MGNYREIDLHQMEGNVFQRIGKDWMLVAARRGEEVNMLTASWGGLGVLWGKRVAFVFLRPQRHTRELVDAAKGFSLTFYGEEYRGQLNLCGSKSGRDINKVEACGFQVENEGEVPYFTQAHTVLICRKLAKSQLDPASFLDPAVDHNYPEKDYHYMYVAEVEKVLVKE